MKKLIFLLIILNIFFSCKKKDSIPTSIDGFEKSFKKQKGNALDEHLDSLTNIYSNFKYHVAFDAPDNWKTDSGVSEHTIFRTYQPDSGLTFSINVIEPKLTEVEKRKRFDSWEFYQTHKEDLDYPFTTLIEEQLNTTIENFVAQESFLKNISCIKRKFNYMVKDLNIEYSNTTISYQTFLNNLTFTFTLDVPTMFYDVNPKYYENLFRNVYFLKNTERLNNLTNKTE